MRINKHRLRLGQDLLVDDRLESEGILRIHEYTGGSVYMEPELLENAPVVAEIQIVESDDGEVRVESVFSEYGHENLDGLMIKQAEFFARFYGYSFVPPVFWELIKP